MITYFICFTFFLVNTITTTTTTTTYNYNDDYLLTEMVVKIKRVGRYHKYY